MAIPFSHPVIFIAGIMGSALRDQYPVDPETVWSPFKLLVKSYERVTLHPSDTRYELIEPARVTADQVFGIIYSEFIEELRHNLSPQADRPVPVFPFAYDWRQPLDDLETQLAAFVAEVIDRTKLLRHYHDAGYGSAKFPAKVHLVGHSLGGLIVAGYVQKHGEGRVAKVATIASPFRGSLEAVAKIASGVGALGTSPGSSREREAARVTPSLYHLLPSFKGAVIAERGLTPDLYRPDAWQPGILQTLGSFIRMYGLTPSNPEKQALTLMQTMLNTAWRHRSRIEKLSLKNSKSWLSIVGVGEKTRLSMRIAKDDSGHPRFELAEGDVRDDWHKGDSKRDLYTGDNTVAYLGARTPFIPTEQVVCVSPDDFSFWEFKDRLLEKTGFHSTLPGMNVVQRLVVSHLRDRAYGDVWGRPAPDLDPGTAWDPPIAELRKK